MNWQEEAEQLPLMERPHSELSFYLSPHVKGPLVRQGQRIFCSNFYQLNHQRKWERQEYLPDADDCPFLTPYRFDLNIAGWMEDACLSETIGHVFGYYIEMGKLLENMWESPSTFIYYADISDRLADFWNDWADAVQRGMGTQAHDLFFERCAEQDPMTYTLKTDRAIFLMVDIQLKEGFKDTNIFNLILNHLIPDYFSKQRSSEQLACILYQKAKESVDPFNPKHSLEKRFLQIEREFKALSTGVIKNWKQDYYVIDFS